MIRALHWNTSECVCRHITDLDAISEAVDDTKNVFWLDLDRPDEHELARIAEEFNLHPLAIEDATHEHQRPKVEEYENFFFVVFYTVSLSKNGRELEVGELNMFVGENYLITVHHTQLPALEEAEQRWHRNAKQLEWGVGILLYSLLDTIVDHYFPIVDALVDRAEEMEDRIYADNGRGKNFTFDLLALKKVFLEFRRIAGPERDVLNVLTNRDSPVFHEHILVYFRDVYDHITRLADTLDLYRDQLGSTMDANLAVASNELNKVMRTLTATSIILMSDALIAGIYGMNFIYMPELQWHYGYFGALGLMAGITVLLVLFFRLLRWL